MDKKLMYETMLNEHRRLTNQILEIKGEHYEMNDDQKRRINELEKKQIYLMNQMKTLFNGNFGR